MVTERPRASRMEASDAAAMPLPSEDTTPPVTKIRGVMESSRAGNTHSSGRQPPPRDVAGAWIHGELRLCGLFRPVRDGWLRDLFARNKAVSCALWAPELLLLCLSKGEVTKRK